MKEKTEKEIFEERYPLSEVVKNPFKISSALGYLECLKEHELSADWVDKNIASLLVTLMTYGVKS